eukprot:CAMPEP_0202912792 /NCGR_PEP_ID=MMETSP1392-20130828/58652_1 /ASSEMBLY_ACC=CAM_ASM_000868 /TAXON_ID=225041 /ORGANISM="Chlamydomonas chlamydogama, Strain SAG 11-48b" /LENGTH=195 /DNA_ID=CAMNT_0049603817 /DNA_START=25 /DNA_END=614 /DNA_ORIENTATION=+
MATSSSSSSKGALYSTQAAVNQVGHAGPLLQEPPATAKRGPERHTKKRREDPRAAEEEQELVLAQEQQGAPGGSAGTPALSRLPSAARSHLPTHPDAHQPVSATSMHVRMSVTIDGRLLLLRWQRLARCTLHVAILMAGMASVSAASEIRQSIHSHHQAQYTAQGQLMGDIGDSGRSRLKVLFMGCTVLLEKHVE